MVKKWRPPSRSLPRLFIPTTAWCSGVEFIDLLLSSSNPMDEFVFVFIVVIVDMASMWKDQHWITSHLLMTSLSLLETRRCWRRCWQNWTLDSRMLDWNWALRRQYSCATETMQNELPWAAMETKYLMWTSSCSSECQSPCQWTSKTSSSNVSRAPGRSSTLSRSYLHVPDTQHHWREGCSTQESYLPWRTDVKYGHSRPTKWNFLR